MNWLALFIIIIGAILLTIGVRGTYSKILSGFSNIPSSASSTGPSSSTTPSTAPSLNTLNQSLGIPPGAPGQGQIP